MVKWFAVLKKNEIEIKLTEQPEEEPVAEEDIPEVTEEAPKKSTRKKKAD